MGTAFNYNLFDSCLNTGCKLQSGIVRTKCGFYMPNHKKHEEKMTTPEANL